MKKAAMFGLDARIALAIFGALSVISGAALYSAIQQAKVIALIAEMREIDKAWEQMYLDTGIETLPTEPSFPNDDYQTIHLISNPTNIANWNGPYISLQAHPTETNYLKNPYDEIYYIFRTDITDTAVGDGGNSLGTKQCVTEPGDVCQTYIQARGVPLDIAKGVDEYIDGTVDGDAGNVRWFTNGRLLIKSRIVKE
jgi:type II secretory pathway pseudopilin PulG